MPLWYINTIYTKKWQVYKLFINKSQAMQMFGGRAPWPLGGSAAICVDIIRDAAMFKVMSSPHSSELAIPYIITSIMQLILKNSKFKPI